MPAYLLPAAVLAVARHATTALWLSRLVDALPCALLLALAVGLLWTGVGLSLLGVLLATTPMVLFVGSILNPSGLTICASLAFAAGLIRMTRGSAPPSRGVVVVTGLAGALTILSFQAGPAFAALDVVAALVLVGRERAWELWRAARRPLLILAGGLLVALGLAFAYSRGVGQGGKQFSIHPLKLGIHLGLEQLSPVLHDSIGHFASLTISLPTLGYWIWWLAIVTLVCAAVALGSWHERLALTIVTGLGLAFPVLSYAWFYRFGGFGLQGRQVLPALMLIPLVAGEVVRRRAGDAAADRRRVVRAGLRRVPVAACVAVAVFQLYAFWINARANAGPRGSVRLFSAGAWAPPLGWIPWLAAGVLGAVLIAVSLRPGRSPAAVA